MKNLHSRIKETRQTLGLSQASLASSIGVSQPTVANWETGSHIPRKKALEKISTALDVEENWLLSGAEDAKTALMETYLSKPIRHVPIYAWPQQGQKLFGNPPEGFFPYPTEDADSYALIDYADISVRHTLFIFDRKTDGLDQNESCLWQDTNGLSLKAYGQGSSTSRLAGRLRAEIKSH